jgi:hypothetical protein
MSKTKKKTKHPGSQPTKRATRKGAKKTTKKKAVTQWQHVDRLQLAELIGVHPDTISDYTRSGMPVITRGGRGRVSKYDAVECLEWWRNQQGKNAKEVAQTRAYEAQAKLNELKLARQREELYPRDEILLAGQQQVKSWTAKIRALPRQMVQAGIIPREREKQISDLLRALLIEISSWKTIDDARKSTSEKGEDCG